jgi:hypothetical protein
VATDRGAKAVALRNRLETGVLTPEDRKFLERGRRVKMAMAQGVTLASIAEQEGIEARALGLWIRGATAREVFGYLEAEDASDDDAILDRKRKAERTRLEAQGENAIAFVEDAFKHKWTDAGRVWAQPQLAMWATERMFKTKGWDQAGSAKRPVIQVGDVTIIARMDAVASDDAKLAHRKAIDITPEPESGS